MPATLYSTPDAFPLLTDYTTRSFDSGLLLWQGTYLTPANSGPPFAEGDPIPDGDYGAIDGLYVHPAPVLKKSPGPLAEWTVTAYGRKAVLVPNLVERSSIKNTYTWSRTFFPQGTGSSITETYQIPSINEIYIQRGVFFSSAPISSILQKPNISSPVVIPRTNFNAPLVPGTVVTGSSFEREGAILEPVRVTSIDVNLSNYTCNNFGTFSEYILVWEVSGLVRDTFKSWIG